MEKNTGTVVLIGLAAVLTIVGAIQLMILTQKTRELRNDQIQLSQFQNRRVLVQQFLTEVGQYSQSHSSIIPVLQQLNLVPPQPARKS